MRMMYYLVSDTEKLGKRKSDARVLLSGVEAKTFRFLGSWDNHPAYR